MADSNAPKPFTKPTGSGGGKDASQSSSGMRNPAEDQVNRLTEDIEKLRVQYEYYFLGRERTPPQNLRNDVDRRLNELLQQLSQIVNTGLKFRIKSLQSKLITLRRYWDRTLQQMEEGTSKRDRFRLKLMDREEREARQDKTAKKSKSEQPAAPPAESTPAAAAARNATIETLMNQFVDAKKKCNEGVAGVSYEAFAKTIASQSSAIKKQYGCKSVRFKVVIENGKTKLKATPV